MTRAYAHRQLAILLSDSAESPHERVLMDADRDALALAIKALAEMDDVDELAQGEHNDV